MRQKPFSYAGPRRPNAGLFRAAIIVLALGIGAPFAVKAAPIVSDVNARSLPEQRIHP
jgi:hypothetical protein